MRVVRMEAQRRICFLIAEKSMRRKFIGWFARNVGALDASFDEFLHVLCQCSILDFIRVVSSHLFNCLYELFEMSERNIHEKWMAEAQLMVCSSGILPA